MSTTSTGIGHHHSHGPANRRSRVLETAAPLFVAEPRDEVTRGAIVLHDVFGLTGDIERYCRSLAGCGVLAVAPYHYYDTGGCEQPDLATAQVAANRLAGDRLRDDVLAAHDYLVRRRGLAASSVAVAGFGMGARLAEWASAEREIALLRS